MKASRGFTLLEMIIGATLLSMIVVATLAAMRTLGNTHSTLEQVTDRIDEVRVVSEFLRNSIAGAMPVLRVGFAEEDVEGGDNYGTYFNGNEQQLTWVTPMLAGAGMGGAYINRLALVDRQLVLRWHPYLRESDAVEWDALEPRILLDNVEEFRIGYLSEYGGEWIEEWVVSQRNPAAVRLALRVDERYWPELVVSLDGGALNTR